MIRFVFVVLLFAAMVYLLVRLLDRRSFGGGGRAVHGPTVRGPKPPTRTIAPDDDEQFLRDLDKRRKEQKPPQE